MLKDLTDQENGLVNETMERGQIGVVSQHKNVVVEYQDIYRLEPLVWLNDELINFYMALVMDRANRDGSLPKVHCFNTHFFALLREGVYAKVRRWTKKVSKIVIHKWWYLIFIMILFQVDLFSKDLIIIPINQSYHWTLGVIDINEKQIRVYDSMGGNHGRKLNLILNYLEHLYQDRKKEPIDLSDWQLETPGDIPQQGNQSDCGMFACTFAERLNRRCEFNFSQQNINLLRRRMALNIINKKLYYH